MTDKPQKRISIYVDGNVLILSFICTDAEAARKAADALEKQLREHNALHVALPVKCEIAREIASDDD